MSNSNANHQLGPAASWLGHANEGGIAAILQAKTMQQCLLEWLDRQTAVIVSCSSSKASSYLHFWLRLFKENIDSILCSSKRFLLPKRVVHFHADFAHDNHILSPILFTLSFLNKIEASFSSALPFFSPSVINIAHVAIP